MKHFAMVQSVPLPSRGVMLTEYRHESGAVLVHIKTENQERAFCAAFRTVPTDSSGVFHILEHSCLSGSEKYPIGSPILYMMNHSMQTYLNAITFQGKTLYPCASCHPGDFENLMRVYLDAVFHPNLTQATYLREGWHLETDGDIRGVVYNEMQGALSGLDARMYNAMKADLYPDTYQRHCAGGEPEAITALRYADFLAAYRQHYSADNCVLLLRGDFQPEEYEQLLHETLCAVPSGGKAAPYDVQREQSGVFMHTYPIGPEENPAGRTGIVFSYNVGDYEQNERLFAVSMLAGYLLGNQTSPLKQALLAEGLAQDVQFMLSQERQAAFAVVVYNTEAAHREKLAKIIEKTVREVIEKGVDKAAIRAQLAQTAFAVKESSLAVRGQALEDFAALSSNVFYGLPLDTCMDADKLMAFLEQALDTTYYEDLLQELFLENPISACSVMTPRPQEAGLAHKNNVKALASALSEGEKTALTASEPLSPPDREEDLAKMPGLRKADLAVELRCKPFAVSGRVMHTKEETAGIAYLRYYFDMGGLTQSECMTARLLSDCLTQLATENRDVEALSKAIKVHIGRLNIYPTAIQGTGEDAAAYMMVNVACLEKNLAPALALVWEILAKTVYDPAQAGFVVNSLYNGHLRSFGQNGMSIAQNRAAARLFAGARYMDLFGGYEYLQYLKACAADPAGFCAQAKALAEKLFCDSMLRYIGVTAEHVPQGLEPALPKGAALPKHAIGLAQGDEAYAVASGVSCNVAACRYDDLYPFDGRHLVMMKLLSRGRLWQKIREEGGAYGTSASATRSGRLTVSSYRDPHVGQSYRVYAELADYLESHPWTERELLGGMISVTADMINPQTPADEGTDNEISWLTGYSRQRRQQVLAEAAAFTAEDVQKFVPIFRRLAEKSVICTVGSRDKIEQSGKFEQIIDVM